MMVTILQITFVIGNNRLIGQPCAIFLRQQETRKYQRFYFHVVYSQFKHRSELPKYFQRYLLDKSAFYIS